MARAAFDRYLLVAVLTVGLPLWSPPVRAADKTPDDKAAASKPAPATELQAITVTALPGNQQAGQLIKPVSVLAGDQLNDVKGSTIGDTVAKIPGVQTTSLGQAVGRPVIHGLGGPRVAVTENGLGSGDVSSISQDHAVTVEPFLADRIEVLKGPSTLLYGSGAIGGVVNVVDGRIPQKAPENGFSGRYESRFDSVSDGQTHMMSLDAGSDHFVLHVDGLHRRDKDYRTPADYGGEEGENRLHGRLPNSNVETNTGAIGGSWLGDWGYLGASVSRYLDDYGSPAEPGDAAAGEDPVHLRMAQTRYDVKGGLNDPFAGVSKLEFSLGHTDYQHTEYEGDDPDTTFTNRSDQARILLTHSPLAGWQGTIGTQFFNRKFAALGDESFIPKTETRGAGLFITEQYQWRQVKFEAGARVDQQSSDPQDGAQRTFHPQSFSAGASWQIAAPWRLTLNLDRSQRAPAEEELFANGPHEGSNSYEVGNPDMKLETGNQAELGLHFDGSLIDAKLSVYVNHFDNFIYLKSTGQDDYNGSGLPRRDWSQDDAEFHGAEAEATLHLARNASGNWDLRTYGDTVRAKLADGGGNVPRIPAGRLGSELQWHRDNWRASAGAVHYYRQDDVARYESETDGFTLVNAHLGWTFLTTNRTQWEAFVDLHNLTNRTARLATSLFKDESPLPGRNVSAGVRAWF